MANRKHIWLLVTLAAILYFTHEAMVSGEETALRRYDAGPLTADDFRAPIPDPLPRIGRFEQLGHADTDIQFQMEYRYVSTPEGVEARLHDVDIFATFMTDKSWLARRDATAIDHEQGHFDITQAYALQANLVLKQRLAQGMPLVGTGEDVQAAAADLQAMITEFLKPFYERAAVSQSQYDQNTDNGTQAASQAEHRKRQIEVLTQINAALSAATPDED